MKSDHDMEQAHEASEYCRRTIELLNQHEADHWLTVGKAIDDYVTAMTEQFGFQGDCYSHLSKYEGCVYGVTQLRNFHACYLLWTDELAEYTDDLKGLTHTHLVQVLPSRYTAEDREKYLRHAAENGQSVSEFRKHLKNEDAVKSSESSSGTHTEAIADNVPDTAVQDSDGSHDDWAKRSKALCLTLGKVLDLLLEVQQGSMECRLSTDATSRLLHIIRFSLTHGLIRADEIRDLADTRKAA